MSKTNYAGGQARKPILTDKVDMSLDDIIRLNKKEQQLQKRQTTVTRRPVKKKGRINQGRGVSKAAGAVARGGRLPRGGAAKSRNKRIPPPQGRRRGQGVITGLAARRPAALLKRGTLNRAAFNQRTKPFVQRPDAQYRKLEAQRRLYRQPEQQRGQNLTTVRRPFRLQRRPTTTVPQAQREARQATFLFRRGLKIQAQVHKPNLVPPVRTRQWRPSPSNSSILTVSIDNPTARTQPEPPSAWTLHPPTTTPAPAVVETAEKKVPKGVPLQFDINSVGKPQTSMTLNERFRILKDKRAATSQTAKGGRFVTVG